MIPSSRAMRGRTASFALCLAMLVACGGRGKTAPDAGPDEMRTRAEALLDPKIALPARPEAIALAQHVEAAALSEGAGARAVELHAIAARVHERIWRIEHREQDAKEAIDLYRAASRDLTLAGACDAAVRGAR